jgi:hypothetical protein
MGEDGWYFLVDNEGGNDVYPTKKRTVNALTDFLGKCYYDEKWGWVMPVEITNK